MNERVEERVKEIEEKFNEQIAQLKAVKSTAAPKPIKNIPSKINQIAGKKEESSEEITPRTQSTTGPPKRTANTGPRVVPTKAPKDKPRSDSKESE